MRDTTDLKILNALLANSRQSTKAISELVDISNVATQQRIRKLEDKGVIRAYTAVLDYASLGVKTIAYVGIFLEKAKNYKEVIAELAQVPQITEAHFTTGNYSIFAQVYARDNQHLMEVLNEHVQSIDGIARTETFISLDLGVHKAIDLEDYR